MKNPFRKNKTAKNIPAPEPVRDMPVEDAEPAQNILPPVEEAPATSDEAHDDGFTEWRRSRTRGGVERRERNDFFEAYSVYGADKDGKLICRYYHRYPEHERDFGLTYDRTLSLEDFNRRLLAELDKGDIDLDDYRFCMENAERLHAPNTEPETSVTNGFTDEETAVLKNFCENIDTLKDKTYLTVGGVFQCECESVVGDDRLNIRFRKPIKYDAYSADVPGVSKEPVNGYDITDLWIMGVYNRLRENCSSCSVTLLSSQWSTEKESLYLIMAEGFSGIDGRLLTAVGNADSFRRFGFYSLDFSKK